MQMCDSVLPSDMPTLLLTRSRPQSERFEKLCRKRLRTASVIVSPIIRITPVTDVIDLSEFAGVVLTSENGARALSSVAGVSGIRAWCVGNRTAKVARDLGMRTVSAGGDSNALVALLEERRPEGVLMHAHGARTRGDVVGRLRAAGLRAESRMVYEQVRMPLTKTARACLNDVGPVALPLFSPRSARLVGDEALTATAPLAIVALSQSVAEAWTGPAPSQLAVAERPDVPNMLESVAAVWAALLT